MAQTSTTDRISRKHRFVKMRWRGDLSVHAVDHALATHLRVDVRDFLNRAPISRPAMRGGDDAPVRALPELLDELILGVDDEGGVEGGEGVPLHGGQEEMGRKRRVAEGD